MKFFSKELYARAQALDPAVVSVAEDEWELANACYEQHLLGIAANLPAHVREFTELLLHDASVQSIARHDQQLVLILRNDTPPGELIVLRYELVGEPQLEPFAPQPSDWSAPTTFNFDEFDVVDDGSNFEQAIVFANGWLLKLAFRDVQVIAAHPLYVAPRFGPAITVNPFLPRSA